MTTLVHIVATGARTPLGLRAESSAAAYRAGISAMGDHPFMLDRKGDPVLGGLDSELDPALTGPQRLLALSESALQEASASLPHEHTPNLGVPIYLGLPELRPGFTKSAVDLIRSEISRSAGLTVPISEVKTYSSGHAAGLLAMASAVNDIRQGVREICLIGGIDSYFHPDTITWLEGNRQLASADARSAFVPGEGAGFCLLMPERTSRRLGLDALATVLSVDVGRETKLIKSSDVCLGEGLTITIRNALSSIKPPVETISDVFCDINGERYRAEEWGFVCVRLPKHFDAPTLYQAPAGLWGDMGAASGPLFTVLACCAASKGYAKGSQALMWASSEGGYRGAAVLRFDDMKKNSSGGLRHG